MMLQFLYEVSRGIAVIGSRRELLDLLLNKVQSAFGINKDIDLYTLSADGSRNDFFRKSGITGGTSPGRLKSFKSVSGLIAVAVENKFLSSSVTEEFLRYAGS